MSVPLPRKPRLPTRPGRGKPPAALEKQKPGQAAVDEFGLDVGIFGRYPRRSREYCAIALRYLKMPLNVTPSSLVFGGGTIPEMVMFGGLLKRGYIYNSYGPKGFAFQRDVLGGRAISGGGAVEDIVVYRAGRAIAVPVQSVFHGVDNPFGGGLSKVYSDREQQVHVLSRGRINAVVPVNEPERGSVLENGPDSAVDFEFTRVEMA